MKLIVSLMMAFAIIANFSCHSKLAPVAFSRTERIDKYGNKMLLGVCIKKDLVQEPYGTWFNKNYSDYKIDTLYCDLLKPKLSSKTFEIFMGTWCGDSRREVPRMFKILDYCGVKADRIKLVMLDNRDSFYKQSPNHEERGMNIHRVPDLIVFENKKEEGRIIESPVVSLEKDFWTIVNNENYLPNYESVEMLATILKKDSTTFSDEKVLAFANTIKPLSKSPSELNTYGYVKMASGEFDKAAIAFRVNAILFPNVANVFDSLGEFYERRKNFAAAKENYEKALQLDPANSATRKKLLQLQ